MGMSKSTLSSHLKGFVKQGWIIRRVDHTSYPPKVFYKKVSPEVLRALEPSPTLIMDELKCFPQYLSRLKAQDPELANQTSEALLKLVLLYQEILLLDALTKVAKLKSKEEVSTFLRMVFDYQIRSDVEWLGELCRSNSDTAHEAIERLLDQRVNEVQRLADEGVELVDRGSALIKKPGLRLKRVEREG